jgi:predicted transcriptional regulator
MANISSVELATELTIAWLGNANTRVRADEVPAFLVSVYETVAQLAGSSPPAAEAMTSQAAELSLTPAVSARKSLASPDHIISLIDGKPYRSLKRHLAANGLTPAEYRQRYGLRPDYPMVAPSYAEARRALALTRGLGRKALATAEAGVELVAEPVKKAGKRARRSLAEATEAARAHLGQSGQK